MNLNFKQVKENSSTPGEFKPISPGRYDVIVEGAEKRQSKSGNDALQFTMRVLGPDFKNRKIWATFSLLEQAQIYLINFLEALGLHNLTSKENVTVDEICSTAVGKTVNGFIDLKTNPNTGKSRNEIEGYKPMDSAPAAGPVPVAPSATATTAKSKLFS